MVLKPCRSFLFIFKIYICKLQSIFSIGGNGGVKLPKDSVRMHPDTLLGYYR